MNNWEHLTISQKSALMKIYLQNNISSIDDMRNHYNNYSSTLGSVENKNIYQKGGFTGIVPIDSSLQGNSVLAIKPSQKAAKEYNEEMTKSSGKNNTPTARKVLNDSRTSEVSSENTEFMNNAIWDINDSALQKQKRQYSIPYIYNKEISINGHRTSENVLDTLYKYSQITNTPFSTVLGLAGQETSYGALPFMNYMEYGTEDAIYDDGTPFTREEVKDYNRALGNSNYFREFGSIPMNNLVRDYAWEEDTQYWQNQHPLVHAIDYYKAGKYNTKDKSHTADVERTGREAIQSDDVKKWANKRGIKLQEGGYKDPVLKDRQPQANFYQRLLNPNRQTIPDWQHKGNIATHKMSYATNEDNTKAIVYPEVQEINGKLYDFTDPKNKAGKWDALDRAIETGDTIQMTPAQAEWWTQHYKEFYPSFNHAQGGFLGKVTPYGQWQYPHQVTTVPSNDITMKGVNYPVLGISNLGDTKLMKPNKDYVFEGDYVTEYPINSYQEGSYTLKKAISPYK